MQNRMVITDRARRVTLFLLRVVSAFMFLQAGGMKLFGWFPTLGGGVSMPLMSQMGLAGILEFFGGTAILLGLFTQPVAFLLAGEMAVAYWQVHAPQGLWPILNQGQPAVLYCFIFLFFATHGGGEWSVDAIRKRKRE